jgi:two-component system response regulator FixJ
MAFVGRTINLNVEVRVRIGKAPAYMATARFVAIVEDDDAVRHSTAQFIESAGFRVQTFASGDEFLARLPEHLDCVLLDMQMPGRSGLDVLKTLEMSDDAPPVLVLTGHGGIALAVAAMRLGAADFLEKPLEPAALLAAIDYACALRTQPRGPQASRREAVARVESLSGRQRQVLIGIVNGQPNKIIAHEMGLSIRTVEAYRAQVLTKLGARSTAEAVRIALTAGLGTNGVRT